MLRKRMRQYDFGKQRKPLAQKATSRLETTNLKKNYAPSTLQFSPPCFLKMREPKFLNSTYVVACFPTINR